MNIKLICVAVSTTLVAIAGVGFCIPNAMWLRHSTIKISNLGNTPVDSTEIKVGSTTIDYSSINPGSSRFALLPAKVNGSVAVLLPPSQSLKSVCHTYVEEKMYHIDVLVKDGAVIKCDASLPILSSFWVLKALT